MDEVRRRTVDTDFAGAGRPFVMGFQPRPIINIRTCTNSFSVISAAEQLESM
jgi:hypothetical protein